MKIICRKCLGTGTVPLPEALAQTLAVLRRHRGGITTEALHEALGYGGGVTAMNQRLAELLRLGLVRRERNGKAHTYFLNTPKT